MKILKPEERIHMRAVAAMRASGHDCFFHCPNESRVPVQYRRKLKALGVSPGVPDLIVVADLTFGGRIYHGLALEVKATKGRVSPAQTQWLGRFEGAGYLVLVTRGHISTADLLADCAVTGRGTQLCSAREHQIWVDWAVAHDPDNL
jgi:hypothetical protein